MAIVGTPDPKAWNAGQNALRASATPRPRDNNNPAANDKAKGFDGAITLIRQLHLCESARRKGLEPMFILAQPTDTRKQANTFWSTHTWQRFRTKHNITIVHFSQ
jgi:hypothetical protein